MLRELIAATVDGPDKVDDEVRDLFAALGRQEKSKDPVTFQPLFFLC